MWRANAPQVSALLEPGARVEGLRVAVAGADAAPVTQALAAAGADAGLVVSPDDVAPADPLPPWLIVRTGEGEDPAALSFRLKSLTSDLRARRDGIRIGLEAPSGVLDRLSRDDAVAYVDFFVVRPGETAPATLPDVWERREGEVGSLDALARLSGAGNTSMLDWPAEPRLPLAWAALASLLGPEPIEIPGGALRCAAGGGEVACRPRSFLERSTRDRLVWVDGDEAVETLGGLDGPPVGATALDGQPLAVHRLAPPDRAAVDPPSRSFVVRLSPATAEEDARFHEAVDVAAERSLTAAEILARHRAAEQGRRRRVPRLIAGGDTTIAFTLPGLSAPAAITARTLLYEDGARREVEYDDLRWNGTPVALDSGRVPRLPIVEPAAAEPPLAIRLNEAYSYRLQGREDVGGRPAYVLSFEPKAPGGARGRAWIDAADFGLSRLTTIRDGLPGPIVASEQRDSFVRMDVEGRPAWLLERSEIHQAYEGPGHHTSIHRVVRFERIEPNPADFQSRRASAHAGSGVLMRETSDGFRYLAAEPGGGERRPAGKKDSVRTVALGVTIDPNVDGPLPFGGVGYLDLDLFGTGTQVNAFLGLGFVQGSFTVPRLGRTRWQAHGALLAVFVRYNDRSFRDGVEIYPETLRQRPSRLTLGVSRPLTARSRLRLLYELEHNALGRSDLTAPGIQEPVSPLAHGARVELELRRGAWTGLVFGSAARRSHWEPWGDRDALESGGGDYQRYGVSLARSLVSSPRATGRLEASWMDGHGLDRFSRYAIDSFLNRLRGYAAGSLRYDRGLLLRGQGSWAPRPGVRADLFLDAGFLRDPGYGEELLWYPGVGLGLELALPRGALLVAEGGYAFAGRDREGQKGTQALQITLVKTF